jgi:hypothetical protein
MTAITHLAQNINEDAAFAMLNTIYHFIDFKILTPAAIGTFITGLIYSLFTKWGFFKHGWIIYKWIITLALILIGTFYLGPITNDLVHLSTKLGIAALNNKEFITIWNICFWAGIINSLLLLSVFLLSILKPRKKLNK